MSATYTLAQLMRGNAPISSVRGLVTPFDDAIIDFATAGYFEQVYSANSQVAGLPRDRITKQLTTTPTGTAVAPTIRSADTAFPIALASGEIYYPPTIDFTANANAGHAGISKSSASGDWNFCALFVPNASGSTGYLQSAVQVGVLAGAIDMDASNIRIWANGLDTTNRLPVTRAPLPTTSPTFFYAESNAANKTLTAYVNGKKYQQAFPAATIPTTPLILSFFNTAGSGSTAYAGRSYCHAYGSTSLALTAAGEASILALQAAALSTFGITSR